MFKKPKRRKKQAKVSPPQQTDPEKLTGNMQQISEVLAKSSEILASLNKTTDKADAKRGELEAVIRHLREIRELEAKVGELQNKIVDMQKDNSRAHYSERISV